ncbi:hypothetical protein [Telmatospirillum sp.]|uniref:hypothetical protein n=1 Tax=Telmatospirillum sp. TaxID=2079197 RepID=UPI00283D8499|nr:hypothetical protein [Telmatospirillum sp.]MDR3438949.1 hypothetical protein [Telmatospirillum sp.]
MPNQFQIVIAAVDKATAVVRKVNQSFGQLTKPIGQVQAAVSSLSKEVGLDRVASGIGNVGRAAAGVGAQIEGIVAPMAAVAGVSSVAAVTALTLEWAKLGAEINRTSTTIGVSTDQLQSLRGAAKVSGVSAESLTGGLKGLGDTMEDALYGRNQTAMVMMNRLGITMKKTASGTVDTTAAFGDLATAISGIKNPQVQGLVARTFGLEDALPLLRRGKAGIEELEQQVKATGAVMSGPAVVAAAQFQKSMGFLDLSISGLRNSIGSQLIPIVQPMVDQLSTWISANHELVATKVAEFATGVADAVRQIDWNVVVAGAKQFAQGAEDLVERLGGWRNVAIGVAVVMNANMLSSVVNLGTAILKLGVEIIPVAVRSFALLAAAGNATLIPALAKGAVKIAVLAEGMAALTAGIPVVGTALTAVSSGFLALGAAIEATPIGWIITGVAGVAVAVYAIYKNWGSIVSFFEEKWNGVKAAFDKSWGSGVVRALIEFNPTVIVANAINGLVEWLTGVNLFDAGAKLMQGLVDGIKSILPQLPRPIANAVRAASGTIKNVVSDVKSFAGIGDPIGIRQNNPGNLRSWGDAQTNRGYAQFPSAVDGISAMAGNLQAYGRHGWNSINSIVEHWAPATDSNNVPAYINDLVKRTGMAPDAKLDLNDSKTLSALIPAIISHENGKNPYDAGVIAQAISSRLGQPVPVASPEAATSSVPAVAANAAPVPAAGASSVSTPTPSPAVATPYSAGTGAAPAQQGAPQDKTMTAGGASEIVLRVDFNNTPPGTRVSTPVAQGPVKPEVRVSYALPGAGL